MEPNELVTGVATCAQNHTWRAEAQVVPVGWERRAVQSDSGKPLKGKNRRRIVSVRKYQTIVEPSHCGRCDGPWKSFKDDNQESP